MKIVRGTYYGAERRLEGYVYIFKLGLNFLR